LDPIYKEGKTFLTGLALVLLGFFVALLGIGPLDDADGANVPTDPQAWTYLVFAIFQTAGLLTMTTADCDANLYFQQNPRYAAIFFACFGIFYIGIAGWGKVSRLQVW
jgi:hypothetical protein